MNIDSVIQIAQLATCELWLGPDKPRISLDVLRPEPKPTESLVIPNLCDDHPFLAVLVLVKHAILDIDKDKAAEEMSHKAFNRSKTISDELGSLIQSLAAPLCTLDTGTFHFRQYNGMIALYERPHEGKRQELLEKLNYLSEVVGPNTRALNIDSVDKLKELANALKDFVE